MVRGLPEGQPVDLPVQQLVQQVKAAAVSFVAIEQGDVLPEKRVYLRRGAGKLPQLILDGLLLLLPLRAPSSIGACAGRQAPDCLDKLIETVEAGMCLPQPVLQVSQAVRQHGLVGFHLQWQSEIVVLDE